MPKVSHYNRVYFLSYAHQSYIDTETKQKQQNMLKSSLLFKKNTDFPGK